MDISQLPRYRHPDPQSGREVLVAGNDSGIRPVVLLHELGGLAQETVDYASTLVDAGYEVHMPVIFGSAGQQSPLRGTAQLCWGRQLTLLLSNRRPKIAAWLASLCTRIHKDSGTPVVVIGMCATGGVVFSVLMEDSVGGAVAAQPSMPFRPYWTKPNISSLGSTTADIEASAASSKPILSIRYENDFICPAGRHLQIQNTFGDRSVMSIEGRGHSTLVYDPHESARQAVLELLSEVFGPTT